MFLFILDPWNIYKYYILLSENLESLERGELKFSCSYDDDESENYGDSCGSVESGDGSDSDIDPQEEIESEETELDVGEMHVQYIQVKGNVFEEYEEVIKSSVNL